MAAHYKYISALRNIVFLLFLFSLLSCSTNRFSITENLNISEEVTADIPLGANQIVAVVDGISAEKLYDMVLDILIEEGYRVNVALKSQLILGTDYFLENFEGRLRETYRIDVDVTETEWGSKAVFSGTYKLFYDGFPRHHIIKWQISRRSKFYFASMLEIARSLPVREIRYERVEW